MGTRLLRPPSKSCGSGVLGDAGLYQAALLWGRAGTFPLPGSALEPPAHGDELWAGSEALTGSLWSELLQSLCVPRGPPPSRRNRTCDQKAPNKGCGSSWKTGSLLRSCLHFKCFSTVLRRLQDVPEHRTAFKTGALGLAQGCSAALEAPDCSSAQLEEEDTPLLFPYGEITTCLIPSMTS